MGGRYGYQFYVFSLHAPGISRPHDYGTAFKSMQHSGVNGQARTTRFLTTSVPRYSLKNSETIIEQS